MSSSKEGYFQRHKKTECSRLRGEAVTGHLGPKKDTDGVGVDLAEALHFLSVGEAPIGFT